MKLSFLLLFFLSSFCLKITQVRLNPDTVKSPGDFYNKSPDATKIITPEYASLKINAHVISNVPGIIEKTEQIGVIPVEKDITQYEPYSDKLVHKTTLVSQPIIAKTKSLGIVHQERDVLFDVNGNKIVSLDDNSEKKFFGIDRDNQTINQSQT